MWYLASCLAQFHGTWPLSLPAIPKISAQNSNMVHASAQSQIRRISFVLNRLKQLHDVVKSHLCSNESHSFRIKNLVVHRLQP